MERYEVKEEGTSWRVWDRISNAWITKDVRDKEIAIEICRDFNAMDNKDFTAIGGEDFSISARDWTEDFPHENGNYYNKCRQCGEMFRGHKRRLICKVCHGRSGLTIQEEFNCFGYFGFGSGVHMVRAVPLQMRGTRRPTYCNTCPKAQTCWDKHRERCHQLWPDLAGGKGG